HADGFFLELRRELPTTPCHVPTSSRLLSAYVADCPESAGHLKAIEGIRTSGRIITLEIQRELAAPINGADRRLYGDPLSRIPPFRMARLELGQHFY
ncbi:hypothetical protein, partial [Nonomuraea monospora]|uniref:hypothetical protein n=1 Tax=Nonomuraea monospora TaxID=568818 RepID=UPI0031E354E3